MLLAPREHATGPMALVRKAVDASVAGHLAAMRAVRPGRLEYEIAAWMQYELQMRGCERLASPAIVASGIHSAYAHHGADYRRFTNSDAASGSSMVRR
jgi:Xaa-Pro aminopeptidase